MSRDRSPMTCIPAVARLANWTWAAMVVGPGKMREDDM